MTTFAALADPTRASILDALAARPRTVNEIVGMFSISQPSISRHLKVLREAELVTVEKDGRCRIYRLNPAPLREVDRWLARYRRFWSSRLDALGEHLDETVEETP